MLKSLSSISLAIGLLSSTANADKLIYHSEKFHGFLFPYFASVTLDAKSEYVLKLWGGMEFKNEIFDPIVEALAEIPEHKNFRLELDSKGGAVMLSQMIAEKIRGKCHEKVSATREVDHCRIMTYV